MNTGLRLELIGMSLVLASTAWTLFFSETLSYLLLDSYFYRIEDKLYSIWLVTSDAYLSSSANETGVGIYIDFKALLENWKDWREGQESIRSETKSSALTGGIIFVIGSVFIILGKYLGAKAINKTNNSVHQ